MSALSPTALSTCVREVAEFVHSAGWDQPPQLFALVPTAELLQQEPAVAATITPGAELTPVAQEGLPGGSDGQPAALDAALAAMQWPDAVAGCVLVQEVLILPPAAEDELDAAVRSAEHDDAPSAEQAAVRLAATHPDRQEARLVAAVLRAGASLCLLQLRGADTADRTGSPELLEHADLAPNLVAALHATFRV